MKKNTGGLIFLTYGAAVTIDEKPNIKRWLIRELGETGLRGTQCIVRGPTVEPDPDNAGGGNTAAVKPSFIRAAFFV
jgi:hypothetical protein